MANVKAKTKVPVKMVRNPFTGKMEKFIPRPVAAPLDMLNPPLKLPPEVKAERQAKLEEEMLAMRTAYVNLIPGKRYGAEGERLSKKYRKLSLEYQHVAGKLPPNINADL